MPLGPGRYDELCTYVREHAKAAGALVIVIDGERGSGFSVQYVAALQGESIARMLRHMAKEIEASVRASGGRPS